MCPCTYILKWPFILWVTTDNQEKLWAAELRKAYKSAAIQTQNCHRMWFSNGTKGYSLNVRSYGLHGEAFYF